MMKRILFILSFSFLNFYVQAQQIGDINSPLYHKDGNVGIGTQTPSGPLEINKSNAGIRILTDLANQPYVTLGTSMIDRWSLGVYETTNSRARNFFIYEDHSSSGGTTGIRFIMKPGGNVGIGTLDPEDYKLKVEGAFNNTIPSTNT
ncbi:hypothetical protein, partial [Xanthovirga aplysinae]|uniref:hypothetical protein n=1 Tax=Xanthovirga aplysinae TaxID=2529853 RepID=UPI0012BC4840